MNRKTQTILTDTVTDVLDRFSFMFADPPEEAYEEWEGEYYHAAITFKGPYHGAVNITAPEPLCREIAANVLGELDPDELAPETAGDALKELLNIVCGELVAELFGKAVVIDLTVPTLVHIDHGKWIELSAGDDNIKLMVDEHPILVGLLIAPEGEQK
jgi:CheY-specific phosphatase CheX